MYPYYKEDLESGAITREEALELLEILRIKDMKLNRVSGKVNREKNEGMAKWHNFTIGGVDKDGRDVTNDITYLLMEAARDTQLPHHTISLRVHENSPLEVIVKALEVVKTGLGMPAFFGDKSFINYFMNHNCDIEDARDYCITGCVTELYLEKPEDWLALDTYPSISGCFSPQRCKQALHELVGIATEDTTTFETFDEFIAAFYKQLDYIIGLAAETANIGLLAVATSPRIRSTLP